MSSDSALLDAQGLLAHALKKPRTWLLAHPEAPLTRKQADGIEACVQRLEAGEPLPYVLGRWEFFGLEFEITPEVLIPRPETELLVEAALRWLRERPEQRSALDVGTGSGCIAIALAANIPDLQVLATDISSTALKVARRNAKRLGVAGRVQFTRCDLLPWQDTLDPESGLTLAPAWDLVVSNLPYIPTASLQELPVYGREPALALDGGPDGLSLIRRLITLAPTILAPGGTLLLEIEASEGSAALSLAYDVFDSASIHLHQDMAGHDRLLEVQV